MCRLDSQQDRYEMAGTTTSRRMLDSAAGPMSCGTILLIATCVLAVLLSLLQQPARPRPVASGQLLGAVHAAGLEPGRHAAGVLSLPAWDTHAVPRRRASHADTNTTGWHPERIANVDLIPLRSIQPGRLEVVRHPHLGPSPVLAKLAEDAHEAAMYRLLYDLDVTPRFLGHVTAMDGRIIGFVSEYVEPSTKPAGPEMRRQKACLAALRRMHARGIAHGDAHGGNCLLRADGTAALIDFELSRATWSRAEFDRDLWIMSHTVDD